MLDQWARITVSPGCSASSGREAREWRRAEELDPRDDPVAAPVPARAAGTAADCELVEADRVAALEDLGIGEPRVGHVRVNGIGPDGGRGRARAAADRLVVAEG